MPHVIGDPAVGETVPAVAEAMPAVADAAANKTKEAPPASQSAVAGTASAVAATPANEAKVVPPASQPAASSFVGQPKSAVADLGTGEVVKAMALRVKYRLKTDLGALKRRLPLTVLGVHPENRGSVYPGADVVRGLGIQLARKGFSQEEADHQGVCVQEPPANTPAVAGQECYADYNLRCCKGQPFLDKCFGNQSHVAYGMLSHNHLLLVLLCWKHGANWDLDDELRKIFPVDPLGRLDLSAAVAVETLMQLHQTCTEGLRVEVLGWQINTEEPGACSLIAHALNVGNSLALRTTEFQALRVLSGECALQSQINQSSEIDFTVVKAQVRKQLDTFVDDPDFPEVFSFVINLGADKSIFLPDLIEFGRRFVDQKKRQLRWQAFAEINKVDRQHPRTKLAALKRAYRKNPTNGFCPSPEACFHKAPFECVSKIEQLLHFFQVEAATAVAALGDEHKQQSFLANVDVAVAEAFVVCKKQDKPQEVVRIVLTASYKYYHQLLYACGTQMKDCMAKQIEDWIDWKNVALEQCKEQTSVKDKKVLPVILDFDAKTGKALSQQELFPIQTQEGAKWSLPWRAGRLFELGEKEAAMRSALQVLYMLHVRSASAYYSLPIDIILDESKNLKYVQATENMTSGDFCLPPCAPKATQLRTECNHPYKVPIRVAVMGNRAELQTTIAAAVADGKSSNAVADGKSLTALAAHGVDGKSSNAVAADCAEKQAPAAVAAVPGKLVVRPSAKGPQKTSAKKPAQDLEDEHRGGDQVSYTFFVTPEWRAPQCKDDGQWIWEGEESMHPFWAVRRLSSTAAAKEGLQVNTQLKDITFTNLAVGAIAGQSCSQTMSVTVPCLVPSQNIPKHTQLVLLCEDQPKQTTKRLKSWKNQVDDDARAAKRPANTRSGGSTATRDQEV